MPDRRVALSLLAHPDDAEFMCAGTLIRLAEAGWEIHIATATAGDCGTVSLAPEEIAEIRRNEATGAARVVGGQYHCLDELDVRVAFDKPTIGKAIDLLRRVAPTLVFTHPRRDYMLDHEQVHLLARSACFSYAIPNASSLPLIEGSTVPWLYYCDPLEAKDPYSGETVAPTTYVNVADEFARKTEALACHESQREWLRSHHGVDEYLDAMRRHGEQRGRESSAPYAEAFVQHRGHPFPTNDLLAELFH